MNVLMEGTQHKGYALMNHDALILMTALETIE